MSIRTRLAIAIALVVVGAFVLSGVVLVRNTRETLVSQVDDLVTANANRKGGGKHDYPPDNPPPGGGDSQPTAQTVSYVLSSSADAQPRYNVVAQLSFDQNG
ncbi:MAG TPA: hypothetical protein VH482_03215, partial [Thermomicrobiales bacterium]